MAAGVDVLPVVAQYRAPAVIKITLKNGESEADALARYGFTLEAPDPSVEWPIENVFAQDPLFGTDVNKRIQVLIHLATLAPTRAASHGMSWLDRIKF